jgi:DNA-directed RNA polymerase
MSTIYDRQVELEQEMQGLGAKRFFEEVTRAVQDGEESSTVYGQQLAKNTVLPLAEAIEQYLEQTKENQAAHGRRTPIACKYLQQIDPKVAAFITVKTVIDCITVRRTLQKTAIAIASGIEDEVRFRLFEGQNKALWGKVTRDLDKRSKNQKHKRTVLIHSMNKAAAKDVNLEWKEWGQQDKFHLGTRLLDLLEAHTDMLRVITLEEGKRTSSTVVEATETTMQWIEEKNSRCSLLSPVFLPTIIPPKPWTNPYEGGYHTRAIRPLRLVKTRNQNYLEELHHRVDEMPAVYQAVNAVQATAWKVNEPVLVVMQQVWDEALDVAAVPCRQDTPLPPKPHDIETNKEARTEWKRAASKVHEANTKLRSKRLQMAKILYMAEKFVGEKAIYFPHQLDFRGRLYAVPSFLNPQGCDMAKSLLQFAEGKSIGSSGLKWIKIHAANCFGEDKCSLDGRVKWADENMKKIVACSIDPLSEQWWTEADKPWQFLAACFELHAVILNPDHVSHLPVSVDGSCNGLQNFSAMLRDEVGGRAVNLLPSELPADIYARVAEVTKAKVQADADNGDAVAIAWLYFGFDRKATKRPVMTLPYGATQYSARQYVMDYITERGHHPFGEDAFPAAVYLARHIWSSIGEVVVAARNAMDWLQKTASIAASEGLPVNWRTPVGFPVLQSYPEMSMRRVKTKIGDTILLYALQNETDQIDKRRQSSGISPNFVHSMDACALMMSVRRALSCGVTNFGMVHDSYGTLAADMDTMATCLREAFVELYETDVLEEFRNSILAGLNAKNQKEVPPCPPKGNLDLSAVKQAVYFFA